MKNINLIFGLFLLIFLLPGCDSKPVIGLLMDTIERERWAKDRDLFVEKVEELGGSVIVKVADSDASVQFQQALELFNEGIDALVIIPVDKTVAAGIVKTAKKSHIPVLAYDRLIWDCDLDFYISTDNIQIGEKQAEYLTKTKPEGNYVLIGGPTKDNNSVQLYLGWMNVLQPLVDKGDIKLLSNSFVDEWEPEKGYEVIKGLLDAGEQIDAIIAGNDALASGAIEALHEHDMDGEVLIAGQDADINAIRNIVFGNQTITVYKPLESMAFNAAAAAVKLAKGKNPTDNMSFTVNNGHQLVPAILLEGQVVNKQNVRMTVISEGFVAEQEVFE
ncbi:substrate-binding domain-containing protein [Sunxiuqinia dokdonensis]|uniref:Ribose ABC transporter substrate-binding protein n=1 Tax=Sunxiuqinia dokdonensis TaxID=1409788 RepID=A0A0L8VA61_9BACT|nr:substrate-binding domain-containing protein [Sunxiuqinia dokdonensis]KOH45365.1 ribose ABC transporter substrate-binding protein [Sunxiuqinia dokdonensis]